MKLTPTSRLVALSVLLAAATGLLWWIVGFPLGRALLDGAPAWARGFGYGNAGLLRLLALALVVPFTATVATSVPPQTRWVALAAIAFGAVLLHGDRSQADVVAVVFLVLGAAAVSESSGGPQAIAGVAIAVVVAFAALSDVALGTSQKVFAVLVRAVFYYAPLLLGPTYLERFVLKKIAR